MTKGRDLFRKCYGIMYIIIIFNIFIVAESKSPSNRIKTSPTVYPADRFDPNADAETLQKAMEGSAADTKAIVEVLTQRSLVQRLEIAKTYKTHYGWDLNDQFEIHLPGNVQRFILTLMTPVPQYYAKLLHDAVGSMSLGKIPIVEAFCTLNNSEIKSVIKAYEQMYGTTLEKDLKKDHSAHFQRVMASVIQANRDENGGIKEAQLMDDAQALLNADKYYTKVTQFNKILMSRSYEQLRAIFVEYEFVSGHDIEETIKNDIRDFAKIAFLTIVKCAKSKASYFAEKLHRALDRFDTDDSTLIQIIVSRSEIDLGDIEKAFSENYGATLASRITADTTGYYQKALLSLIDKSS